MTALDTPMGEHPDLPAQSGVDALLGAAASTWSAAVRAVAEVRNLHWSNTWDECQNCNLEAPCPTMQILEKWGL